MQLPDTPTTTVETASRVLEVAPWTLYKTIREGTAPFPVIRVGKRVLIPTAALRRLLDGEVSPT